MDNNKEDQPYYGILGEMILGEDSASDLESWKNDVNEKTSQLKDDSEVEIHRSELKRKESIKLTLKEI